MTIRRLNHAVLWVRDVNRSVGFYRDVLEFEMVTEIPGKAVFLRTKGSTNDHDLGVFAIGDDAADSPAGSGAVGLYHLAWEVETLADLDALSTRLRNAGALVGSSNHSTTKSLYAKDPDGLEFEVAWLVPAALLDEATINERLNTKPLDLAEEIAHYGARTPGGIGISRVAS
jgi:catechol-2,3-dioxygenase